MATAACNAGVLENILEGFGLYGLGLWFQLSHLLKEGKAVE